MIILLTPEQRKLVSELLESERSVIITQSIWNKLNFEFSKTAFARRATYSIFNVKIGYSWEEYEFGVHSTKALVQLRCQHCNKLYVALGIKLSYRKYRVQACPKCYLKHHLRDEAWSKQNAASQRIAQNRPATLEKHKINSRKLWTGEHGELMRAVQKETVSKPSYKANMARSMSEKWESDPDYRDRVSGKGVYKHVGKYENRIVYHSKLELAFLLYCEEHHLDVKRCDLTIKYLNPVDNKIHDYYPDFVADGIIVEVKGQRWVDVSPETFAAKCEALKAYCIENQLVWQIFYDKDLKEYTRKASKYHENQKEKSDIV